MYSLSIDYLFNRIYDVLLWIKYVTLFVVMRKDPEVYLEEHEYRVWDGLRDRGWFDAYFANKNPIVPDAEVHAPLWQKALEMIGIQLQDSDGDGIPDIRDVSPHNSANLTQAELKERYQEDYTFTDYVRDFFGFSPLDTDGDGVPDSYEDVHGMDKKNPDMDSDGVPDGEEIRLGTNPRNNDTDGDSVIDGRDEAPTDPSISSIGEDSDGDGVSDRIETLLGMDTTKTDTDGDGIPDGFDTYATDPTNNSLSPSFDVNAATAGIHFSVQNPLLSLLVDILSIATIAMLLVLVYASFRWFIAFFAALLHYEHHFEHGSHGHGESLHVVKDTSHESTDHSIPGLPIHETHEETPSLPPAVEEFDEHPRFAIIKGYMSSTSEALWRIGIMESDTMLYEVLAEKGYEGETLGDMLKIAKFNTVSIAWDAHRTRNKIAHDGSAYVLTEHEAKRVFGMYEAVFRELKAIK